MTSFADRHIGVSAEARQHMLAALGIDQAAPLDPSQEEPIEALMRQAVPASIFTGPSAESVIPRAASEAEALAELRALAARNTVNRAMIGLGHGLDISIVAEGVETEDQLTFLAHENCDQVQGYFLGKPAPVSHYAEIVGKPAAPASARRAG